jgi:Contractile injection system tube protein
MTEASLIKARLMELKEDLKTEVKGENDIDVQFNPDSLKVTFSNQVVQPESGDQASGTAGMQFVGKGSTKLALTLWFDVTAETKEPLDDVRRLTKKVSYFMTTKPSERDASKEVPPGVRFIWGNFMFDGMVEGIEESLEFFSPEGKPLRASLSLTLVQQKILVSDFKNPNTAGKRVGQQPFQSAKQGDSVQNMAGGAGKGGDWQSIASANGIEDPLRLAPGQLLDLNAGVGISGGFGVSASIGGGAPAIGIAANINISSGVQGGVQTPPLPRLGLN